MQVVIEIPDVIYSMVRNTGTYGMYRFNSTKAIKNGTPLPEGHGRLIDADAFQKYCFNKNFERRLSEEGLFFINMFLSDAPTILEADKENE